MTKANQKGSNEPNRDNRQGAAPSVFDLILDQVHDGICLQDASGRVEWMNPACEKIFGWSLADVRGKSALGFILPIENRPSEQYISEFSYKFDSTLFGKTLIRKNVRRDGSHFWNQQSFALIDPGTGDAHKKVVITCRDITDQVNTETVLREVQIDLEYAAYHDNLTGLANRKKLTKFLQSDRVKKAIAIGQIGVLQLDIDKFKDINDTLGHAAGDATLCHVAQALHQNCGRRDLACRTGGDEFLLICLKSGTKETLMAKADALIAAISVPLPWKNQTIRIGTSIGACLATSAKTTGEELIQHADQALYSAKNGGRGHVVLYTDSLGQHHKAEQTQARELKTALAEQQFEVFLQPQLRLGNNRITGCEALIRWRHPEQGLFSPAVFLPTAERCGLLSDIDYVSMNLALDALSMLHKEGFPNISMSINVSSSILSDVNYPGLLDWAMQSRGIKPQNVCVEILETTILDGADIEFVTAVERLKRLGVRVALDDFGTGYAGLAHMSTFEIDALKIDRSMIARLIQDPRDRVIVRSIIRLCAILGIEVVAEGVETNHQLEILRRAKCPLIQGYGLAHPMSVLDTIDWLHGNTPLPSPVIFGEVFQDDPILPLHMQQI